MANEGYRDPVDELGDETRDMHRAIVSLMEELEAVDWSTRCPDERPVSATQRKAGKG